jgi:hypothetical protein
MAAVSATTSHVRRSFAVVALAEKDVVVLPGAKGFVVH